MKFLKKNSSALHFILFTILFIGIIFFVGIHDYFLLKPRGIHFMRQTDSLSFIDYYAHNGYSFFNIGNLNLYNETGRAACEFPILYYLASFFVYLDLESYVVLKFFHIIIFYFTAYLLIRFLKKRLKIYDAYSIVFLLFSSTIILFYLINYIPNFPALCFSLSGIVYFFNYQNTPKKSYFIFAVILFTIASLLKITFAIYPITCFVIYIYKLIIKKQKYNDLLLYLGMFVIILSWNLFVINYNTINSVEHYLTSTKPMWLLNSSTIKEVISFILNYWIYSYYYPSTIHLFFITLIVSIFYWRKIELDKTFFITISFLGGISYLILFFYQFKDHDYYFMEFVPLFFVAFITAYQVIKDNVNKKVSIIMSLVLISITCLSLNYAKLNLSRRYAKPYEQVSYIAKELENIKSKLDSFKISKNAKILVVPDATMNGSLYYLNRFGYTVPDTINLNLTKYYNKADYILVTDSLILKTIMRKFSLSKPVLKYNNSTLFKINNVH